MALRGEVDSKQTSSSSSSSSSSSFAWGIPSLETEYAVVDPPLKRLSHFEYNNTVAEVLKTDLQPADNFSWQSTDHRTGFDHIAKSRFVIRELAEDYLNARYFLLV